MFISISYYVIVILDYWKLYRYFSTAELDLWDIYETFIDAMDIYIRDIYETFIDMAFCRAVKLQATDASLFR